ncbi:hypothetical protein SDC9_207492 [bioreactor metagenome]|uniref:Uncharacterized protein n=1 Tax=bioreactor metagenome TaxID=1076179 RepID=A0A645J9F0_9ZZZZ
MLRDRRNNLDFIIRIRQARRSRLILSGYVNVAQMENPDRLAVYLHRYAKILAGFGAGDMSAEQAGVAVVDEMLPPAPYGPAA